MTRWICLLEDYVTRTSVTSATSGLTSLLPVLFTIMKNKSINRQELCIMHGWILKILSGFLMRYMSMYLITLWSCNFTNFHLLEVSWRNHKYGTFSLDACVRISSAVSVNLSKLLGLWIWSQFLINMLNAKASVRSIQYVYGFYT